MFGAVAAAPVSVRYELLDAPNPLIRQAETHDSGWGMATYRDVGEDSPLLERFPVAAGADRRFEQATRATGRIFNTHVRRATLGGLTAENTHPFEFGPYTFSHNGTILRHRELLRAGTPAPKGETDSECFFLRLLEDYDPAEPVRSIRGTIASIVPTSPFSGLNFLFSDGIRLYAYRLGVFELHWTTRPGLALVASEVLTEERWHRVSQDVLLTFDPESPEEPHAQRLLGDLLVGQAEIRRLEPPKDLHGVERGRLAADWAANGFPASLDGDVVAARAKRPETRLPAEA